MPYLRAHYYLLLLFPMTLLAFWPGYFSDLGNAAPALHIHGLTASLWMGLLVLQSWTIHRRQNGLHRSLGMSAFLLLPLFAMGGVLVVQSMAAKTLAGHPFYAVNGAQLATIDLVATVSILYLVHQAMRHRRNVHLHATYMLGTIFFLVGPILARFLGILPMFAIRGPQDFDRFFINAHVSHVLAAALIAALAMRHPRSRKPLLVVGALVLAQSLAFETLGRTAWWRGLFLATADMPSILLAGIGFLAGLAALWTGWNQVKGRARPAATA